MLKVLESDRVLMPVICEPAVLKGLSEALQLIRGERPDVPIDVIRVRYRSKLVITREADDLLTEAAAEAGYTLFKTEEMSDKLLSHGFATHRAFKRSALSFTSLFD